MPHLIPNLFEKSYTPYTAKLAPKNLWSRPQLGKLIFPFSKFLTAFHPCIIGRKPAKVTFLGADPTWKSMWRLIRSWICHNHKVYYTYSIACAFLTYQFWWYSMVGYYRQRNAHRSLEHAILREQEWDKIKPVEPEYDDEDDEEEEAGEAAAPEGGDDAEEEE